MFAAVRETTFDPARAQIDEFTRLRAEQPGYRGSVTIDAGDGRLLIVTLWETAEQGQAAGPILQPMAERLMGPLWTTPPRVIASGPVVQDDIPRG